jgi:hypothetical protein
MFVVMALVTTVATTPLTSALYPLWYQKKLDAWKRGEIDWDGNRLLPEDNSEQSSLNKLQSSPVRRLLVYLRLDSLPSLFTFISLLGDDSKQLTNPIHVHGMRVIELTERTSSVMQVSETDENTYSDPVVNAFRTVAQLHHVSASGSVSIIPEISYAKSITEKASDMSSDLVVIPWSETGAISEGTEPYALVERASPDRFRNEQQNFFIRSVLDSARCNALILINSGCGGPAPSETRTLKKTISGLSTFQEIVVSPATDLQRHIFFPFFGGPDDRLALRVVLQLAQNPSITVSIVHVKTPQAPENTGESTLESAGEGNYAGSDTTAQGDVAASQDIALLDSLRESLPAAVSPRVSFSSNSSTAHISSWFSGKGTDNRTPKTGDAVVVGRRKDLEHPITQQPATELRKTLGATAACLVFAGVQASILVVQAAV